MNPKNAPSELVQIIRAKRIGQPGRLRRLRAKSVPATVRQLKIIDVLVNSPKGLAINEISKHLDIEKTSVNRDLRFLENFDLVIRRHDTNKRGTNILRYFFTDLSRAKARDYLFWLLGRCSAK